MMDNSSDGVHKQSLLQKYNIPIEFLDFDYIKTCKDFKTLEKIVKILRSAEEGYYPDLTNCAVEQLKSLNPDSKMFRMEQPALKIDSMVYEMRTKFDQEMTSWICDMKKQDQVVQNLDILPKLEHPIRKINNSMKKSEESLKRVDRIKSTDYQNWDKFDADTAVLKIDLDEERQREIVGVKNKKNLEKGKLIEEVQDEVDCLTEFEKENSSIQFKNKGNECYKAGDYDEAIKEYTQSLRIKKSAAAFNNRALVQLKLKNYIKVIADTNECLQMEPDNAKALVRKAQAFNSLKMFSEAHDTFMKVADIDSSNNIAKVEIAELKKKLPMQNAFRMKIEEISDVETSVTPTVKRNVTKSEKLEISDTNHVPKMVQNIVIDESTPLDILLSKEKQPKKHLQMPSDAPSKKNTSMIVEIQ